MSHPSATSGLWMWMRAPQTQSMPVTQHLPPPPTVIAEELLGQGRKQEVVTHHTSATPEGTEDVGKKQDLTPDSWGAYERSEFSKPRGLHLSKHRKTLNSFAWYLLSPYLTKLLMFRGLPALLQTCIAWIPLLPPGRVVSSELLRAVALPSLESLTFPPNKTTLCSQVMTIVHFSSPIILFTSLSQQWRNERKRGFQ